MAAQIRPAGDRRLSSLAAAVVRRNWSAAAVYFGLAVLILGPAMLPGYILTLDMVFTPNPRFAFQPDNLLLFHSTMNALAMFIPAWLLQKMLLIGIFMTAGLGLHRLVPTPNQWAKYAAGLFYVINPFTYERLLAGQYLALAGYALLPWLVAALLRLLAQPRLRKGLALGGWLTAVSLVSLHFLGFGLMLLVLATGLGLWQYRRHRPHRKQLLLGVVAACLAFTVASSYWLIPLASHGSSQAALIASFDQRDFLSFHTEPSSVIGTAGNTLALYGFWGEREGWFTLPKAAAPYWWIAGLLLLAIMLWGLVYGWRRYRVATVLLGFGLIIGWVLAQGVMDTPFAMLNHWLFSHVPLLRGYREPGKFVALIALAESLFLGLGITAISAWLHRRRPTLPIANYAPAILLALPLLYTPNMLLGAAGQLRATDYPADWYALNETLGAQPAAGKVLFLPWHQYLYFDFTGRLIANPASKFFDRPTIAGDNPEIGLIQRPSPNPTSAAIELLVLPGTNHDQAAERLARLGIQYVVLAKGTPDSDGYGWLSSQPGLTLARDTPSLTVYHNQAWSHTP